MGTACPLFKFRAPGEQI